MSILMPTNNSNRYSITELASFRTGNVQYIPATLAKGSREYNEIVEYATRRGYEVKEQPTD